MDRTHTPYDYIVVEGVIGVGKTSLCKLLADRFSGRCVLEHFESNPFIEDFYRAPRENAFKTQLYFLVERFRNQLNMPLPDLFNSPMVVDYLFEKDRIFATVNLEDDELDLYNTIWNTLAPKVRRPDLVVYLQASTSQLLRRIVKRGRSYEQTISPKYLEALNNAYNEFFFHYADAPVFIVNTDDIDFVDSTTHFTDLTAKIMEPHSGITFYHPGGI